jgi:hypothetical protein
MFVPGELMEWELTWKGIAGGRTRLMVGQPGVVDGKNAIIIRSETRSDGLLAMVRYVRDDLITTVDLETSLPIASHGTFEFGKQGGAVKSSRVDAVFHGNAYDLEYERKGRRALSWTQRLPKGEFAYDVHSVLGALRAWEPADGTRAYFYALSGRRLYLVEVAAAGREQIKIGLGPHAAMRYEGRAVRLTRALSLHKKRKPREFTVWVSDDSDRVPLKIQARTEYGDVNVELVAYDRATEIPIASR